MSDARDGSSQSHVARLCCFIRDDLLDGKVAKDEFNNMMKTLTETAKDLHLR